MLDSGQKTAGQASPGRRTDLVMSNGLPMDIIKSVRRPGEAVPDLAAQNVVEVFSSKVASGSCADGAAKVASGSGPIPMVWNAPPSCALMGRPRSPLGVDRFQWCEARRHHLRSRGGQGRLWESTNSNGVERAAIMCAHGVAKVASGSPPIPMVWSAPPSSALMGRPRSALGVDQFQWCGARRHHVRSWGGQGRLWESTNSNGVERAAIMCAHGAARVTSGSRPIPMVWSATPSSALMGRPRSLLGVDQFQWCGARRHHVRSWGGQGRLLGVDEFQWCGARRYHMRSWGGQGRLWESTDSNGVERAAIMCAHGAAKVASGSRPIPMVWSAPPSWALMRRPRSPLGVDRFQWCGARRHHVRSRGGQGRLWESTDSNGVERAAIMCAHGAARVASGSRPIPMVWSAPPSCALMGRPRSHLGVDQFQLCGARRHHVRSWGGQGRLWKSTNSNGVERAAIICAHGAARVASG
eukprot:gene17236-biopygen8496